MERLEFSGVVLALLENALAELRAGEGEGTLDVELGPETVTVRDDGRGLPVHAHPTSGRRLLEVILTGPRRGPRNTLARVNSNCFWLDAEVHRDGELWFQRHEFARPVAPAQQRGAAVRSGTTITCAPAFGAPPTLAELRDLVRGLEQDGRTKVRIRDARDGEADELRV